MLAMSWSSKRPENLGIILGALAECPDSPNCVSTSTTKESHKMAPIPFKDTNEEAMAKLVSLINSMPRTKIVSQTENYLHVEFTSLVFRYVDDVEFLIDRKNHKIDFRSASRVGYSDLGTNRKRMKTISERFINE